MMSCLRVDHLLRTGDVERLAGNHRSSSLRLLLMGLPDDGGWTCRLFWDYGVGDVFRCRRQVRSWGMGDRVGHVLRLKVEMVYYLPSFSPSLHEPPPHTRILQYALSDQNEFCALIYSSWQSLSYTNVVLNGLSRGITQN